MEQPATKDVGFIFFEANIVWFSRNEPKTTWNMEKIEHSYEKKNNIAVKTDSIQSDIADPM